MYLREHSRFLLHVWCRSWKKRLAAGKRGLASGNLGNGCAKLIRLDLCQQAPPADVDMHKKSQAADGCLKPREHLLWNVSAGHLSFSLVRSWSLSRRAPSSRSRFLRLTALPLASIEILRWQMARPCN